MSIRLNKALRELNIGLQTAVEFLEKRSDLGEVKSEPSFKLNDEQYAALETAFKQDAEVRNEAEKLFPKKEKKRQTQAPKGDQHVVGVTKHGEKQTYTPLGKMDLGSFGKKPAKQSAAPEKKKEVSKATAESPVPVNQTPVNKGNGMKPKNDAPKNVAPKENVVSKENVASKAEATKVETPKVEAPKMETQKPVEKKPVEKVSEKVEVAAPAATQQQKQRPQIQHPAVERVASSQDKPEVFTLKSEKKISGNEP